MKKLIFASLAMLTMSLQSFAQNFGDDVHITQYSNLYSTNNRQTVAYNGDIYVARIVRESLSSSSKTVEILKSTNKGATWAIYQVLTTAGSNIVKSVDIMATGANAADFKLYVVRAITNEDMETNYLIGAYYTTNGSVNSLTLPDNSYVDNGLLTGYKNIAIASDWESPSANATTYTVSIAVSKRQSSKDSLILYTSQGSLTSFQRAALYGTSAYIKTLDADLGNCSTATSNHGRVGMIWVEQSGLIGSTGIVKGFFAFPNDGNFNAPSNGLGVFNLDIGEAKYSNSNIALSKNSNANDIQVVMTYQSNEGSVNRIITRRSQVLISAVPTFSNWTFESGSAFNCVQPDVYYNKQDGNFKMTHYNITSKRIPVITLSINNDIAQASTLDYENIRNASSEMSNSRPRIVHNNITKTTVLWADEGKTMFDCQNTTLSFASNELETISGMLYPNPATNSISFDFRSSSEENVTYKIVDLTGREVLSEMTTISTGQQEKTFDISHLQVGQYILYISTNNRLKTFKFNKAN